MTTDAFPDVAAETGPALRTTAAPGSASPRTPSGKRKADAVLVTVMAGGKPLANRGVRVWGTALRPARALFLDERTGPNGTCRLPLPPGSFHIGLIPYPEELRARRTPDWTADPDDQMKLAYAQRLELEKDDGRATVLFRIPAAALRVVVRDADGNRPLEGVEVKAFVPGIQRAAPSRSARTDEHGVALVPELVPGEYRILASKAGWVGAPEAADLRRMVAKHEQAAIEVSLRLGGTLVVGLIDVKSRRDLPFRRCTPTILDARTGRAPAYGARPSDVPVRLPPSIPSPAAGHPAMLRVTLAPGTYRLSIEDQDVSTPTGPAIRVQPFEPIPVREFEIRARETTSLEVPVRPRPRVFVDLRPPQRRGSRRRMEVEIFRTDEASGERLQFLQPRALRWFTNRFDGYLPPGIYDVEIRPAGSRAVLRTERLTVAGEEIQKTYEYEDAGR